MSINVTVDRKRCKSILILFLFAVLLFSLSLGSQAKKRCPLFIYEGGGGYSGPTVRISPGELINKKLASKDRATYFVFDDSTMFAFERLKWLQYNVPDYSLIPAIDAPSSIHVKEVRSTLPEEIFNNRVEKNTGEAVMVVDQNGIATVLPFEDAGPFLRGLLSRTQAIEEELHHMIDSLETIRNDIGIVRRETQDSKNSITDLEKRHAHITGFIYGIIALLGTGLLGVLFSFAYKSMKNRNVDKAAPKKGDG